MKCHSTEDEGEPRPLDILCARRFTARSTSAFSHHGFPDDVIALAVRWYVRYRLSYADVVELFAERPTCSRRDGRDTFTRDHR